MVITKNIIIDGKHNKSILVDLFYKQTKKAKPIVIFAHGYKGFKDWGCWNLIAEQFALQDIFFIKFNFSHNGGTVENPVDFPDLEAFGQNNYTKELDDLQSVIDWVLSNSDMKNEIDTTDITLIGHSRGGGIVTIKSAEEPKITRLITWASISNFSERSSTIGDLEQWKKDGVKYVLNGRTKQQMPHYYQFYENFKANEMRLNIERSAKEIVIPHLIIHGTGDDAIHVQEAKKLHAWSPKSELYLIENANHTFGASHPYTKKDLPKTLQNLVTKSIVFVNK